MGGVGGCAGDTLSNRASHCLFSGWLRTLADRRRRGIRGIVGGGWVGCRGEAVGVGGGGEVYGRWEEREREGFKVVVSGNLSLGVVGRRSNGCSLGKGSIWAGGERERGGEAKRVI